MDNKVSQIDSWIRNRKSTFVNGLKEGEKIENEVIEKLLENATWAPSHGLGQTWFFKVFEKDGVKSFFKEQKRIYKEITPENKFFDFKYDAYDEKHKKVSHVVAIIAKRDPYKRFPQQEDLVSVACAVQNIYLSLEAYGVAGYLSTGDICYSKQIREFLKLEEDDVCLGFFILGIADENFQRPPRTRASLVDKIQWISN